MGNSLTCGADESELSTPFGKCSIKHWGCAKKAREEPSPKELAQRQIDAVIRVELGPIEHAMRQEMLAEWEKNGYISPIHVHGAHTPALAQRALSVRIKMKEATPPPTPVP